MYRTLSSAQTFLMKFVFPFLWIGGFAVATASMFLDASETGARTGLLPPPEMKWSFLAITVIGSVSLYWLCMRLKRVSINGDSLLISNYFTSIVVPLTEIERVSENRWINIHPVTIFFRRETDFGPSVVFMPETRWFGFFSSHPVVAELQKLAGLEGGSSRWA